MQKSKSAKILSTSLNVAIFLMAFSGIILSMIFAVRDGYSHWLRRLMYFTQQSNLWMGITALLFAIALIKEPKSQGYFKALKLLKFIFTVSITVTGVIFCSVLAPFADYNVWTGESIITHVVVPILSVVSFFTDPYLDAPQKKQVPMSLLPPLYYFIFSCVLCLLKVDFGRGVAYPYFFMDFYSEAGLLGFVGGWPPQFGSVYWIIFFLFFIWGLGLLYRTIKAKLLKNK